MSQRFLKLPEEIFDHHLAVIGKVGSGKTFMAKGEVERLLEAGRRVCVVDPTGGWWGLKSSADGAGPGFPVAIFGGRRADVPILDSNGAALGELIAESNIPAIIDLSEFYPAQMHRFMTAFAETLYAKNCAPLNLVIDEADEFAPQKPMGDSKKMLNRMDRIVRRGRIKGLRVTMITQRPAVLNKDVLTQANALVVMRLMGPQDRAAVEAWVKDQAEAAQVKELMASLPTLAPGEGWVWAPESDFWKRGKFPPIKTYDSSRAPDDDEAPAAVTLAEINLTEISEQFAEAARAARENDPKELHKQIAALKRQVGAPAVPDQEALGAAYARGYSEALKVAAERSKKVIEDLMQEMTRIMVGAVENTWYLDLENRAKQGAPLFNKPPSKSTAVPVTAPPPGRSNGEDRTALNRAEVAFLTALAQQGRPLTRNQMAIFAGYSAKSRHVDNVLASLRANGYVEGGRDAIKITEAGLTALGPFELLPTGAALQDYWCRELDKASAAFLRALCDVYPGELTRDALAEQTGYSPTSRHVDNTLAKLRSRELVSGDRSSLRASPDLFDGAS